MQEALLQKQPDKVEANRFAVTPKMSFSPGKVLELNAVYGRSPSQFFMVARDDMPDYFGRPLWIEIMNKLIKASEVGEKVNKIFCGDFTNGKLYLRITGEGKWSRVRLLMEEGAIGWVFNFETGLEGELVDLGDLREMPALMGNLTPVGMYRCHLFDVVPAGENGEWGKGAVEWFERLTKMKRRRNWEVLVMSWDEVEIEGNQVVDLGVVIWRQGEEETVNAKMVKLGYARPLGIGGLGVAHVYAEGLEPIFAGGFEKVVGRKGCFPGEINWRLPQIEVKTGQGMDLIYVMAASKVEELEAMKKALEEEVANGLPKIEEIPDEQVQIGMPVVVKGAVKEKPEGLERAVVVRFGTEGRIGVLLVDLGIEQWTNLENIYWMPGRFVRIPAFVQRCHLRNLRGIGRNRFLELLEQLMATCGVMYAVRSEMLAGDEVKLRRIHEELRYDPGERIWKGGEGNQETPEWAGKALVANYFVSVGFELLWAGLEDGQRTAEKGLPVWKGLKKVADWMVEKMGDEGEEIRLEMEKEMEKEKKRKEMLAKARVPAKWVYQA